ncbi:MAG: DUF4062 domain-containing protein [Butyrivibrio sp.]|nr:DUF4062 domain-containing protein [Butyrivibrio sp.]
MNKKYQIFISSTFEDLKQERVAVRDAILRMSHFPVGMEQFGAADEKQWMIISDLIDTSDYYVLIMGNRYGSVIPDSDDDIYAGMSYTEKEMRYADEKGVPILAFLPDKSVPIQQDQLEDDEKRKKLEFFKNHVKNRSTVAFWNNADNLASLVTSSLYMAFGRTERPGWVRGVDAQSSLDTINDLSRKVRELENENSELKKAVDIRSPKLVITVGCNETLEEAEDKFRHWENTDESIVKYEETKEGLIIHMKSIPHEGHIGNTDSLVMDDVPDDLQEYVSQKQLDEYNEKLPSQEEIAAYNSRMFYYKNVKENGVVLNLSIGNDGNCKASNISIDFDFPESFTTIERGNAIDLAAPKSPKMPKNPIIEAQKEHEKKAIIDRGFLNGYISAFDSMRGGLDIVGPSLAQSAQMAESIKSIDMRWSVTAQNHHVRVWKDSLMHKHEWNHHAEFCVVPTKPGEYIVKISTLCEELPELIHTEYKIRVVDDRG